MKTCPPRTGTCQNARHCPARTTEYPFGWIDSLIDGARVAALTEDPFAWIDSLIERARVAALLVALLFTLVFAASYLYTN